jgi:hypothetical protein
MAACQGLVCRLCLPTTDPRFERRVRSYEVENISAGQLEGHPVGRSTPGTSKPLSAAVIDRLDAVADGLMYGTITMVFHDGKVIQIERAEKIRLNSQTRGKS